jgi:hypothetical protein
LGASVLKDYIVLRLFVRGSFSAFTTAGWGGYGNCCGSWFYAVFIF